MPILTLPERFRQVVDELKRFPTDEELSSVPYWGTLAEEARTVYGGLDGLKAEMDSLFVEQFVDFPNQDQEEATTQILEKRRILIRDSAGAGKTAPAVKAKYGLEQLFYDGQKIVTLVVCPSYVASSWKHKINEYTEGDKDRVKIITSKNRETEIENLRDLLKEGKIPDFIVVSYEAIFRGMKYQSDSLVDIDHQNGENGDEEEDKLSTRLLEYARESQRPLFLILDEPQHIKNPKAFRSQAVRELALNADHIAALSGTIFPDSLDDIYELMSLFDNKNYPTAKDADQKYLDDPRLIRLFLQRFGKQPVIDVKDEIEINHQPSVSFELSDAEKDIYNLIRSTDMSSGEKYTILRIAATDVRLVDPRTYRGSDKVKEKLEKVFEGHLDLFDKVRDCTRYRELDKLVEEINKKGEKAIIFSVFREGVTEELEKRYAQYGTCRIDGTVESEGNGKLSPRDIQRLEFQTNPDKKIMIATINSLREGQDIQAANNVIFVNEDVSPGFNDQAIGRAARKGQTKPVSVYKLRACSTIDFGIAAAEAEKRRGIEMIDKGFSLTQDQKDLLKRGKVDNSFIKQYLQHPETLLQTMFRDMTNRGARRNIEYLNKGDNARLYAENYNYNWDKSYSGQTARLIKGLVDELEKSGEVLGDVIDLGSGPATVSRVTKKRSLCVDINKYQLEFGKLEAAKLGIEIDSAVGNIEDLKTLGVDDQSFDLAVMSLVLHYGNAEDGSRTRMLLEANRVLRPGGYFVLTLPTNRVADDSSRRDLERGLTILGFEMMGGKNGIVRAVDSIDKEFKVYAALCRKVETSPEDYYKIDTKFNHDLFRLNHGIKLSEEPQEDRRMRTPSVPVPYRDVCNVFQFENGDMVVSNGHSPLQPAPEPHPEEPKQEEPQTTEDPEKPEEEKSKVVSDYVQWLIQQKGRKK